MGRMFLGRKQRLNGVAMLRAVQQRARNQGWGQQRARHMAIITVQCCMTESNMRIYANWNNPESLKLPHDAVGSDHASVGMFQQQVPGWGTTADCMDPALSCHKFMARAAELGVDAPNGLPNRMDIQRVQVSFDPNGFNYARNRFRARLFVNRYWDTEKMEVRP